MTRRVLSTTLAALMAWLLVLSPAGAATAQQTGPEISLRPVDGAGNALSGPGYFVLTAQPGETVLLHALVSNSGSAPATVTLQAVDAATSAAGGISYNLPDQPVRGAGAWVDLSQSALTIEPGRAALVPFQLRVPADATAGEHVGGLTAFVPASGSGSTAGGQAGQQFAVRIQTRTVSAIVVNVPGTREAKLAVSGVDVEHRPDAAYLVVRMRNTGNVLTKAQGSLLVTRAGETAPLIAGPIALENTLPGTDITFPIQWMRDPAPGRYQARVELTWDGGRAMWEEAFNVTAAVTPTAPPGAGPIFIATANPRAAAAGAGSTVGVTTSMGDSNNALVLGLMAGMGALLTLALGVIVILLRRPRPARS
jgi:hypothetical protein